MKFLKSKKTKKRYLIEDYKKELKFCIKGCCIVSILYTPFCMYDKTMVSIYALYVVITIFIFAIFGIIALINQKKLKKIKEVAYEKNEKNL